MQEANYQFQLNIITHDKLKETSATKFLVALVSFN